MPALDGVRALAVAAVVMFHLPITRLGGGYIGVDLFLVLSGYLITSLLMAEAEGTGRIRLGAFWMRRIRRLIPALVVMLAVTAAWMALVDWSLVTRTKTMLLAGLGYVTNWYVVAVPWVPWRPDARSGAYEHLWSLAVEEQFYLVWPLVMGAVMVLFGLGRRTLLAGAIAGAAASVALSFLIFDESWASQARIYLGTDTRAIALLIGIIAALALPPARFTGWTLSGVRGGLVELAGVVGLVGTLGLMVGFSQGQALLYQGGFAIIAVVAGLLVIAAAHPDTSVARLFSLAPLIWIGARSYGIYLWHLPVVTLLAPEHGVALSAGWLSLLHVVVTVTIAALSYRFIEMPIRTKGFRRAARARATAGPTS
ncbi:MAG: acyltransferase family protein [Actinomycetota bacterium]